LYWVFNYFKILNKHMIESDVIIIGAGPVGCVLAERISSQLKLNCLIIEKRSHIGGNCYD